MDNGPKATIIYVGDPMCSWCYGFSPEIKKVKDHFDDQLDFELVMGGLRPYNTETMTDLKSFLTGHWQDVHNASGQPFSYAILDRPDLVYDTEPPCRAVVTVRRLSPDNEMAFFSKIQSAFYEHYFYMGDSRSYHSVLKELGISVEDFDGLFSSDKMKESVRVDFQRAANLGVSGFPTVLIQNDDKVTRVSSGYTQAESLISKIESIISK